ncbi:MAG: nucleotidyltransferase family protein [Lentisphaerae bacterium]|nr:nucleotidyltransferase family protein [Lentisphaerota bacterium]
MHFKQVETESKQALQSLLSAGKSVTLTLATNSMSPAIRSGDQVTVMPMPVAKTAEGDVVLCNMDNDWIVHRLISIRSSGNRVVAVTAGDRNTHVDEEIFIESILGKCTMTGRNKRTIAVPPQTRINHDNSLLLSSFALPSHMTCTVSIDQFTDSFVASACREGLGELIYFNRASMLNPEPETGPVRTLKNTYMNTLARNTIYLARLNAIDAAMSGTEFILLKGAYLASSVYQSPGLRRFSDIDILVHPSDVRNAIQKLDTLGYVPCGNRSFADKPAISQYLNSISLNSIAPEQPAVHLHWHLVNSMLPNNKVEMINMQTIWNSSWRTGNQWRILSPEHLILHLAAHAMKHSYDRLILVRDIAEVLSHESDVIDWDSLLRDAIEFGLRMPVYYALLIMRNQLGMKIPADVMQTITPAINKRPNRLFRRLVHSGRRGQNISVLAYLADTSPLSAQCRLIRQILFPPKQVLAYAYSTCETSINWRTYLGRFLRGNLALIKLAISPFKIRWKGNQQ